MSGSAVLSLFPDSLAVDWIFYKSLSANDDSGRHGVLVPSEAYSFFPRFQGFDPTVAANHSVPIVTRWQTGGQWVEKRSTWLHYHRYPERRISSLVPSVINVPIAVRLLIVGYSTLRDEYPCVLLTPRDPRFEPVVQALGIDPELLRPGFPVGVFSAERLASPAEHTPVDLLRRKLREVAKLGYVESMRSGDTGVGFTLETLLGIEANSAMGPDFLGIEIKASRSKITAAQGRKPSSGRVTLLSQIPEWGGLSSRVGLLDKHGYTDENGRWSLYMTIYAGHPNPQGWSLVDDPSAGRLWAARHGNPQVSWAHHKLAERIAEKHQESAFVTAHTKVHGSREFFWFDEMTYCRGASLDNFLQLTEERYLCHDFALHRREDGTVRDHGFLFRLTRSQLPRLFSETETRRLV